MDLSSINIPDKLEVIPRDKIEDKKWNGCVHFSSLGLPYAYTWYLDIICEEWEALILGDYRVVFPLIKNRKWGFDYLYQPLFAQQLGIIYTSKSDASLQDLFIRSIPEKYKLIEIALNETNNEEIQGFEKTLKSNYYLFLNRSYEELAAGYSKNHIRNLEKGKKKGLRLDFQIKPEVFADFYKEHTAGMVKEFTEKHFYRILRLIYKAQHYSMGIIAGVRNAENELIAMDFLIRTPKRIINLMPTSSSEGKSQFAMFFLIDSMIRNNANKQLILDFEGSNIESIARFYKGFGAEEVAYPFIKRNNLPPIIKWLK